jgi:hypothetical protein
VPPWTDNRIWDSIDAWRWIPLGSQKVVDESFELAVTPGLCALTYADGLHPKDGPSAEAALDAQRHQVLAHGGTGVRVPRDPHLGPEGLVEGLERRGYQVTEQAEAIASDLVDENGKTRFPGSRRSTGVEVCRFRKLRGHFFPKFSVHP